MEIAALRWSRGARIAVLAVAICCSHAAGAAQEACARGEASFLAGQFDRAQEALWNCVLSGAKDRQAAHHLILTYKETRDYDAGLKRASGALEKLGKSPDLLYIAAYLHFRMRRHEDSLRLLGDAYRLDNFDWRVHQLFALNYVVLDIRDGALAELQTAVSLNPRNAELHYQLARFYHSDGRIAESIVESRKALDIFPDYAEAYENLGLCYGVLADKQQAVDNFERAIAIQGRLGQKNEWPFVNYAEFLIKQNESESALRLLQRALEVNPSSAKANYFMGRAMRSLDRNAEARLYLEQALKLDAADPDPYFALGMLLMRLGDRAAAKPLLDRFQQLRNPATKGSTQR